MLYIVLYRKRHRRERFFFYYYCNHVISVFILLLSYTHNTYIILNYYTYLYALYCVDRIYYYMIG